MRSRFLIQVNARKSHPFADLSLIWQRIIAHPGASSLDFMHSQNPLFKKVPGSSVSMEENELEASLPVCSFSDRDSDRKIPRVVPYEGPDGLEQPNSHRGHLELHLNLLQ
jgi:hypothetical protein